VNESEEVGVWKTSELDLWMETTIGRDIRHSVEGGKVLKVVGIRGWRWNGVSPDTLALKNYNKVFQPLQNPLCFICSVWKSSPKTGKDCNQTGPDKDRSSKSPVLILSETVFEDGFLVAVWLQSFSSLRTGLPNTTKNIMGFVMGWKTLLIILQSQSVRDTPFHLQPLIPTPSTPYLLQHYALYPDLLLFPFISPTPMFFQTPTSSDSFTCIVGYSITLTICSYLPLIVNISLTFLLLRHLHFFPIWSFGLSRLFPSFLISSTFII